MKPQRPFISRARCSGRAGESSVPPVAIVLLVLIAVLIGATLYLYLELRTTKTEMAEKFQTYEEQLAALEGSVNRTSREVGSQVAEVKGIVASAEQDISQAAQKVEQRVMGRTQNLAKELEQTKQQQQAALQEVGGKLSEVSEVASTAHSRVGELSGTVDNVQANLEQTQSDLKKTIEDLTSVRGDLGVQSGLIATNGTELDALKRLGKRNYYEFDLQKSKEAQKVGRIQIRLRDTNEKKNRYTIEVLADDKTIQKKNKTLLEPVQFYVIGSKIPYEIVVNKLEKNRIAGYLATPLDDGGRATAAAKSE